jgi:acetylornithine deacetylase/succinyl-diaminopimelate desuccinylase family protein
MLKWIVQGYGTMMHEIDEQLGDQVPDLVIGPVGAGSFMQAVVSHYKAPGRNSRVLAVEADTAASLYKSLTKGELVTVETTPTIMAGLNCGIISGIAWPLLQAGVDASLTISDYEAHQAVELLKSLGVSAGACGAASLGALRRLATSDKAALCLNDSSVIVLLCTESAKEYNIPKNVSVDDAQSLTQNLVQIGSAIPGTGYVAGPGETEIARYITAWLQHRDIETRWLEPTRGRPSVIGMVRGTGQGKSLMLNGHIDTVTTASYDGDPLSGQIKNGRLYGRGSADMKGGIAAILIALAQAKEHPLHGDLIFTGVADEEDLSLGTEQLLEAGWRADGAIICEPTQEDLVIANKGFVWFEVVIHGLAAHGSRFDLGIDAISRAGYFLVELDKYSQNLIAGPKISTLGPGSVHASIIKGGEEPASYPASCTIKLERRIVAGESVDQVKSEIENVLQAAARGCPGLSYDLKVTFSRPPFEIAKDDQFVSLVADQIKVESGKEAEFAALSAWCDAALLADKGIPVVIYGPKGEGLHAKEEWVDIQSIDNVASTLIGISRVFCGHIEE